MQSSRRLLKVFRFSPLFFVITALIQFGSAAPMLSKLLCCFGKKQRAPMIEVADNNKKTKIIDLPDDCWYEIFRCLLEYDDDKIPEFNYYSERNDEVYDSKPLVMLSHVCKAFKNVVQSFPDPLALGIDCSCQTDVLLKNKVFKDVCKLRLSFCDFVAATIVLPKLHRLTLINCNGLNELTQGNELRGLHALKLYKCKDFNDLLKNLENLRKLTVENCDEFNNLSLQGLTKQLQELTLNFCHCLKKGTALQELTSLEKVTLYSCTAFTSFGLKEGLENLCELILNDCPRFNDPDTIKKLEERGCKVEFP